MKSNMSSLKEQRDVENSRANIAEHRMMEMIKATSDLQQKKAEVEERVIAIEKQNKALMVELKKAQQTINEIREGKAALSSRVEQLEKEKVALVLEQISHVKEIDSLHELVEAADDNITALKAKLDEETKEKQEILSSRTQLGHDMGKLREGRLELEEHISSLTKELKECEAARNDLQELHRTQQLENTARINEYSEKDARQAEEIMRLKEEVVTLSTSKSNDQSAWDAERTELTSKLTVSKQKLSLLSDEVEEYAAKLESCRAEVDELRERLNEVSSKHDQRIEQINVDNSRNIEKVKSQMKAEFDREMETKLSSYQQAAEEKYRNVMLAAKEANDRRTAQFNTKIEDLTKELDEAKAALVTSEIARRNETEKVNQSLQQMKDLRKFSEENASKLQDRIRAMEKEKAMLLSKYKAEVDDLNEQLVALNESIKRKDNNIEIFRQQINAEKETRFTLSQRLLELEDYQSKTKMHERSELHKVQSLEEQLRTLEQRFESIRNEKDAEIERLHKRNEMLSETVTRLTAITRESAIPSNTPRTMISKPDQLTVTRTNDKILQGVTGKDNSASQIRVPAATIEDERYMVRSATSSTNVLQDKKALPTSQSPSPRARVAMSEQVNLAINKTQEAIDRRKMKSLEIAIPIDSSNREGESLLPAEIPASLRLLKADIESTPKSKVSFSPSTSPSRRDLDKSFTEKLRETVTSSKDYEVSPFDDKNDESIPIDIHEEY